MGIIDATARLMLHQGAVDIGQGSNTVIPQIAAEALGLPLSGFRTTSGGDTALTPDAGKTSGSRQTYRHRQGGRKIRLRAA
jgi:aldehyde oxidoreductase